MKYFLLKILVGIALAGCTINTVYVDQDIPSIKQSVDITIPIVTDKVLEPDAKPVVTPTPIEPKEVLKTPTPTKARCGNYRPPPVPKPARIDLKELEAAASDIEINAIALKAVKRLHKQLENYATEQEASYDNYVRRCGNRN